MAGCEQSPAIDRKQPPDFGPDSASQVWLNVLSRVASVFGCLVYIGSLRDPNSGLYAHYGIIKDFGVEETDSVIRKSHRENFEKWFSFSSEQQKADLDLYFSGLTVDRRVVLKFWGHLAPYQQLTPDDADEPERQLYLAGLGAILRVLSDPEGVDPPAGLPGQTAIYAAG